MAARRFRPTIRSAAAVRSTSRRRAPQVYGSPARAASRWAPVQSHSPECRRSQLNRHHFRHGEHAAPLDAPYATRPLLPLIPETEAIFTIEPGPRARMCLAASRETTKLRIAINLQHLSEEIDAGVECRHVATDARRIHDPVRGPNSASQAAMVRMTASSSATFICSYRTRSPIAPRASLHRSRLFGSRSATTARQPSARMASTTARPCLTLLRSRISSAEPCSSPQ